MKKYIIALLLLIPALCLADPLVLETLKDPDSAQFRKVQTFPNGNSCGEVNAKNGYGGYVGFRAYKIEGGKVHINHSPLEWNCKTAENPKWEYPSKCEFFTQKAAEDKRQPSMWLPYKKQYCEEN